MRNIRTAWIDRGPVSNAGEGVGEKPRTGRRIRFDPTTAWELHVAAHHYSIVAGFTCPGGRDRAGLGEETLPAPRRRPPKRRRRGPGHRPVAAAGQPARRLTPPGHPAIPAPAPARSSSREWPP